MDEEIPTGTVLSALLEGLAEQGFGPREVRVDDPLTSYPVHGTLDVQALAEAVESALGGGTLDDGKSPAELNAANDG